MGSQAARNLPNAAELRREFDLGFTVPAQVPGHDLEAFLAIRAADHPFLLRIGDLSRLEPARKIAPLPGGPPGLRGLAGVQGRLTPVYGLAEVLGLGTPAGVDRWIAVYGRVERLGLSFERFERVLHVAPTDILAESSPGTAGQATRQMVQRDDAVWPILHLPSVLTRVRVRIGIPEKA